MHLRDATCTPLRALSRIPCAYAMAYACCRAPAHVSDLPCFCARTSTPMLLPRLGTRPQAKLRWLAIITHDSEKPPPPKKRNYTIISQTTYAIEPLSRALLSHTVTRL